MSLEHVVMSGLRLEITFEHLEMTFEHLVMDGLTSEMAFKTVDMADCKNEMAIRKDEIQVVDD